MKLLARATDDRFTGVIVFDAVTLGKSLHAQASVRAPERNNADYRLSYSYQSGNLMKPRNV